MSTLQSRLRQDLELLETFQERIKLQTNLQMTREKKQLEDKLVARAAHLEQKVRKVHALVTMTPFESFI